MKSINLKFDRSSLVQQYGLKISRLSHRMIQNNELAKEAAQEVWLEIFSSIESFKGDSQLSTWIYTVAKRTIIKYSAKERIYKKQEIEAHLGLSPIEYQGDEANKSAWVREKCDYCLTAFCHCLDNDSRMIFLFRHIAELEYNQIAEVMETSNENIRQILSRSKTKVKNFMNKNCFLFNPNAQCKCRIKKQITLLNLDKEYNKLAKAAKLIDFYKKFDKELPRKNYWEKFVTENVTI